MDAGLLEAQIGFDAGADIVTVLGLASTKTLYGVKKTAVKNSKEVMVDMINHPCPENKWNELKIWRWICAACIQQMMILKMGKHL